MNLQFYMALYHLHAGYDYTETQGDLELGETDGSWEKLGEISRSSRKLEKNQKIKNHALRGLNPGLSHQNDEPCL